MSETYEYELGLDLHKKFSVIAVNRSSKVIDTVKVPNDRSAFDAFFSQYKDRSARVTFESSRAYYWLVDYLNDTGIPFIMSNPFLNRAIANVRAKTDKYDARTLAELTRADLIARCHVPGHDIRSLRELVFQRRRLVSMRTKLKNMIHTTLAKYNLKPPYQNIFGPRGRSWIAACRLPDAMSGILDDLLATLDDIERRIDPYRKLLHKRIKDHPYYRILKSIHGIDVVHSAVLIARIDDINRFPNVTKFVRYAGLAVETRSSAGALRCGHLNKRSDKFIRTSLVEAAYSVIRRDVALDAFYHYVRARKGSGCAIVAVARKLARSIYFMLKNNSPYRERRMQPQWLQEIPGSASGSTRNNRPLRTG